jgi:hypothetical protein
VSNENPAPKVPEAATGVGEVKVAKTASAESKAAGKPVAISGSDKAQQYLTAVRNAVMPKGNIKTLYSQSPQCY